MKLTRRLVQLGFFALVVVGVFVVKGNAEQWCPFGGVEALYNYWTEGNMLCSLGVSNLYILAAVLVLTLLLRRVFCGYACPIGAASEWLGAAGKRIGLKPRKVPEGVDSVLRLGPYAVLAAILYITIPAAELHFRAFDPCYAILSRHGEDITFWAYVVLGAIVLGSFATTMPFCRWLCPLGAVFNPFSWFGYTRVRRNTETCTNCGKCSRVCPMAIPVAKVQEVRHSRCISCLNCVEACPAIEKGAISWGPPAPARPWPQAVLLAVLFLGLGAAVAGTYLFPVASYVRTRGTPPAATETVSMKVANLTCRGRGTMISERYLWRDDMYEVPGYLKLEAWPGPGFVDVKVTYDPAQTSALAVKQAITEPYYNSDEDVWLESPFQIEGYDPMAESLEAPSEPASADPPPASGPQTQSAGL